MVSNALDGDGDARLAELPANETSVFAIGKAACVSPPSDGRLHPLHSAMKLTDRRLPAPPSRPLAAAPPTVL